MRGQSMFYKIRNILLLFFTLALLVKTGYVEAQGIVALSDSAAKDDELNQGIPNEISLFADDGGTTDELGVIKPKEEANSSPKNNDTVKTKPETPALSLPVQQKENNVVAENISNSGNALNTKDATPIMADKLFSTKGAGVGLLGTNEQTPIDDEIFSQMSDIEKQTALLNLELRREKIRNEIEALKNQRKQAVVEEQEKKEAQRREKLEWEKEQEQKVLQEQQKLRELDIKFENARQEKLLNAYKNQMLAENQKWIKHNGDLYKQIDNLKKEKLAIYDEAKEKFASINQAAKNTAQTVQELNAAHKKQVENLETQISVLKARIEAQEQEMAKQNPFADENAQQVQAAVNNVVLSDEKLSDMYAVMEIRGQGGELIAKLINKDGTPFYVKKGTALQSGHTVDEITSTYVRAERNGLRDYLYFAAGGILPLEQPASAILPKDMAGSEDLADTTNASEEGKTNFVASPGVPGLGKSMIVR